MPTLHPGQVVILDNLSVQRIPAARQAIEAAGCQLRFLPAYSPDFNPIELIFSQLKIQLRTMAARTVETLMTAIGEGLNAVTAATPAPASATRAMQPWQPKWSVL